MFFHKSKPLATAFACAAAAMFIGVAANPAQADRRSYCGERDSCNYPTGGIVQKERDGVNYFYGGFHVESPSLSYIYVIDRNLDQRSEEPIPPPNLYTTSFQMPLSKHRFRQNKDHWKWVGRNGRKWDFPKGPHSDHKFMGP